MVFGSYAGIPLVIIGCLDVTILNTTFKTVSVAAADDIMFADDKNYMAIFWRKKVLVHTKLVEGIPGGGHMKYKEIKKGKIVHFFHSDLNTQFMIMLDCKRIPRIR